jgi:Ni,Fe-hydrogenase maturation factor
MLPATSVAGSVRDCVSQLAHGHPVIVVDQAHYRGHPAIVIVLGNPDTVIAASYSCVPLHTAQLP